jgi:protease I
MAKVLMVIAPSNFRDEEYFETRQVLESAGFSVLTASKDLGAAKGMLGGAATPDIALPDAKAKDYDAVVFVGGNGAKVYFDDSSAKSLAKDAFTKGKVVAAICIAPTILANAGILKGRKATVFKDDGLIDNLKAKGAEYTGESVTVDGKVVTANGPPAAKAFGKAIAEAMA